MRCNTAFLATSGSLSDSLREGFGVADLVVHVDDPPLLLDNIGTFTTSPSDQNCQYPKWELHNREMQPREGVKVYIREMERIVRPIRWEGGVISDWEHAGILMANVTPYALVWWVIMLSGCAPTTA
ncbi:hypothetical protein PRIC1_010702 [Phytophthora ramorum]